jgi:RNA polymerase sigma-70 factor (ECF subfamily)
VLLEWRQRWNHSLLQFLRRRTHSTIDVEDLAQETYLRLLRAPDLTEVRNPLAYLLQVASHVAFEWRDRQPREASTVVVDEEMLMDAQLPELEIDARLMQERLERTLAEASPLMRAVLLLRVRDERPLEQIAIDLQITVRQVRRYLARGYERLRAAIEV